MTGRTEPWSVAEVREQLRHAPAWTPVDVADLLLAWAATKPLVTVTGGSGPTNGTLRWEVDTGRDTPSRVLLLYAYPNDRDHPLLELDLEAMFALPPYDDRAAHEELMAKLAALAIPRLDTRALTMKRPNLRLAELTKDHVERLLGLVEYWIQTV